VTLASSRSAGTSARCASAAFSTNSGAGASPEDDDLQPNRQTVVVLDEADMVGRHKCQEFLSMTSRWVALVMAT
jgi:hypothetical protein